MNLPTAVQTSLGRTVRLGKELGKGGEGAVYEIVARPDLAAKLYWPGKAAPRREKIAAMVAAGWHKSATFIAFPAHVLFAPNGEFAGFAMRRVGGHKPIHQLYSPASRKTEFAQSGFAFLVQAALNVARAIASVHQTGCVIGDINHSGILISHEATATLIDSDSFQIATPVRTFLCEVGVPEFTPPELQGKRFDHVKRTPNHDAFGLAVLIFQLLFMGRHPFSGRFTGPAEMPLQRAISEFRFAYSSNRAATRMQPPPNVPLLSDFPKHIADAFERSFGREGASGQRPTAADWVSLLEKLRSELALCAANKAHHYYKGASSCPWCRMESANPGFVAFGSLQQIRIIPTTINVNQLINIIAGIRDPGPAPDINSVLAPAAINPSANAVAARAARWKQWAIGAAAALAGVGLLIAGIPPLIGIIVAAVGIGFAIKWPQETGTFATARRRAEAAWNSVREMWTRQAGNKRFLEVKTEVSALISSLKALPDQEQKRMQQLEQKKRDAQLTRFLEKYHIAHAKIKKISSTRKVTLASYGIETAADVVRHRIEGIAGFGPHLASQLIAWRQSIERRFVFDPNERLNPADVNSLRSEISRLQADLERRIRASVATLQHVANDAIEQRNRLKAAVNASFRALKQAELDEQIAATPIQIDVVQAKRLAVTVGVLAVLAYIGWQQSSSPVPAPRPSPPPSTEKRSAPTSPSPYPQPQPQPKPNVGTSQETPQVQDPLARAPEPSIPTPRTPSPIEPLTLPQPKSPPAAPTNPASPPADGLAARAEDSSRSGLIDLGNKNEAKRVQQRLIDLSYLDGPADGIWGARSRRALQEFRTAMAIRDNSSWDEQTQQQLFSESAKRSPATLQTSPQNPTVAVQQPGSCWISTHDDLGFGYWGPCSDKRSRPVR